jgi:hypothetical protein
MKVRDSKIIKFDIINKKANLQITPSKNIEINPNTVFASRYNTGFE